MQKGRIANCVCKRKKKERLNDKIKQIEEQTEEMKPGNSINVAHPLIKNKPR
jgi:hypothetical protein